MKKGDTIIKGTVERIIYKVYKHYFLWYYPEYPEQIFDSRNSNDPTGVWWTIKSPQ